jgi:deoxyribodipyrimidine photolyase-related protein
VSDVPTLLILGDQLTRQVGPLAAPDAPRRVLMIESRALLTATPIHAQKATLFLSAMRHFAQELRDAGHEVHHLRHDQPAASDFASGVRDHVRRTGTRTLVAVRPTDHGVAEAIEGAAREAGADVDWRPDERWICRYADFDAWAEGRSTLRMEDFYRTMRRATGLLMDGDQPRGGRWNYDADNRAAPPRDLRPPAVPAFEPDAITREVQAEVAGFERAWGEVDPFAWPVTREQALTTLDAFLRDRLPRFGTYQDAMITDEPFLWHSTLSVPLNLGLLQPREVIDAAIAHADDAGPDVVPMNALEGFVRQVLGWREFVHQVYRTRGREMRGANALDAHAPLPPAFWGAPTELRCLGTTIEKLRRTGYTHHIERLMVLGNLAQLSGSDPREALDWFTATHLDALDWVMVPNVLGMSQYADGGTMTSKPYAAGANYLNRMSDACASCRFDPRAKDGDDACPVTDLYWAFIDRHQERFARNHRMRMIVAAWRKRDPDDRTRRLQRAEERLAALQEGRL